MSFEIRKTNYEELDRVMPLFDKARVTMAALGIDQWQDGYPQRERIVDDIDKSISYVAVNDGEILGTMVLLLEDEPDYKVITDGEWLTGGNYLTIHRITVDPAVRGGNITSDMFHYAEKIASENGLTSIRIDTHKGNITMRKALEKRGYTHCGSIYLSVNGAHRVAYEKLL